MIQSDRLKIPAVSQSIALPLTPIQLGLVLQIPVLAVNVLFIVLHHMLWGTESFVATFRHPLAGITLLLSYPLGIILHEVLHAVGFVMYGAPWKSIRFGMLKLTAYCQCNSPVSAQGFRSAVALPGVVLGLLPALIGLVFCLPWLTLFGGLFTSSALADALTLWTLRSVPAHSFIVYHPRTARYQIVNRLQ